MRNCIACLLLGGCFELQRDTNVVRGQLLFGEAALEGALVRLALRGSGDPTAARTVLSQANGEYRFTDVPPGDYAVFVTTDRWVYESNVSLSVTVSPVGGATSHPSAIEHLLETVQLTPAGVLSGELDLSRVPDVSAEAVIINLEGTPYQARTDALGRFDFGRLPVGRYQATAIREGIMSRMSAGVQLHAERSAHIRIVAVPAPRAMTPDNAPPTIAELAVTPLADDSGTLFDVSRLGVRQLMRGTRVRVRCAAADTDGDALVYSWQISGGVSSEVSSDTIEWSSDAGVATLRCTVTDPQGAFATATTTLDVVDYAFAGATLGATRVVYAQSDAGVPDFDLVVRAIADGTQQRLSAPGQQTAPRAFGETVLYASDVNASAPNPFDVYGRTLPAGVETRLSSTDGSEVYDIGPAGIAVARNDGHCEIALRSSLSAPEAVVHSSSVFCDRVVVGQTTLLVREATPITTAWKLINLLAPGSVSAPSGWTADTGIVAAFTGTHYVAALPISGDVVRLTESFSGLVSIGTLPQLSGTRTASIAGRGTLVGWTAFDDGGLYGGVRGLLAATAFELPLQAPMRVLGSAQDHYLLIGDTRTLRVVEAP